MDLNRLDIFSMLKTRMGWLTDRQRVLAQNVANADTPDYRAQDLQPLDFDAMLRQQTSGVGLRVTDASHIAGNPAAAAADVKTERQEFEAIPSGNSVVLEEEMMKVAKTAADYELMANLYQKHVGMIKTAIGRGK